MTDPIATPKNEDPLESFVQTTVTRLWQGYRADRADTVASLARLRRTFPHGGVIHPESFEFLEDFPVPGRIDSADVNATELAAASALALFAMHQQSRREQPLHRRGDAHALGRAAARLRRLAGPDGTDRRMRALIRIEGITPALEHLRGLVILMRAHDVPLDYARLARDLRNIQRPSGLAETRIRWSRDYFTAPSSDQDDPTAPEAEPGESA